ncbi:MAG: hypothetical protein CVV23_14645 [Ignavibacteriae bacterium HGW-Ignavibacteriae-2]|nr:MAG: hypothetical protein CVV23_14645 [Ignavibacteriae bacterium HGW-Ignavibacteriae-2]
MNKLIIILSFIFSFSIYSQSKEVSFYHNGEYDYSIPKPEEVIGYKIGDHPINYGEMVHYLTRLSEKSPLIQLHSDGVTHQGRKLYYLIITSETNMSRLEEIKQNISKLADPRKIIDDEADKIIENSPAIAFMMYSIHGNEVSGSDAGIQLAYQLAAGTDEATKKLLNDLVIIIYPMENPDGRQRFLSQLETWRGKVINNDVQSLPHSGVWPSGRTNHYHFDLNRDWFILSQPESKARVKIVKEWKPQLVVDAHEMGSFSSFLFNPPRAPINPNMDLRIQNWWNTFASDQAKEFDKYGWSYYTREWLEEWYPGYGSSYPSYLGAIAILYEQARTSGMSVKRPDGIELTFAESVQHQFISSIANLTTASKNKKQLLRDYYTIQKDAVNKGRGDGIKNFIVNTGGNLSRANKLIEILLNHGIEVFKAEEDFSAPGATNYWNEKPSEQFKKGSLIVPVIQPAQSLINAIMEFDTRMTNKFLKSERESLEKGEGTRLYEVSSWSLPLAFGLDVYVNKNDVKVKNKKVDIIENIKGKFNGTKPGYGYLIKYTDDSSIKALLKLFENKINVRCANKPFKVENNLYGRGTLLIRAIENPDIDTKFLEKTAFETGVEFIGVNTALSESGSDLGGDDFQLLTAPVVALMAGSSIDMGNYGNIWHLLDNDLEMRITTLSFDYFGRYDLRKYNVLIIPNYYGSAAGFKDLLGDDGLKKLKDWVAGGGTLVAIGNSAASFADSSIKLGKVKLRGQNISKLDEYEQAYLKQAGIKNISIDSLAVWEGKLNSVVEVEKKKEEKGDLNKLAEQDKENKKFMPQGAIVRIDLNEEHWLNFGSHNKLAALYSNSSVLHAKSPVETAAYFADRNKLRLSGLLWPEASERLTHASYLTRERIGNGQMILFADEPNFRSYFEGTERLLLNSILLGPGFGTRQTVDW